MENSKIPQRDSIKMLSSCLGIAPSVVQNIDSLKENVYKLFCLALGAGPGHKLPSKDRLQVCDWMKERYVAQGKPLEFFKLDSLALNKSTPFGSIYD